MPHDHPHGPNCGCGHDHDDPGTLRFPVAQAPQKWRPRDFVRAVAIGIFRRGDQVLAAPVHDDAGQIKGWRPLGGGIRTGERAAETLRRELQEETGQDITDPEQIAVMENIFSHEGETGHEIIFVFNTRFTNDTLYEADQIAVTESNGQEDAAKWISLPKARAGRVTLFPDGLADLLD